MLVSAMKKLYIACLVFTIISLFAFICMILQIESIPPYLISFESALSVNIFKWIILPIYLSMIPVNFLCLTIALKKISKEIQKESFEMFHQICDLERTVEKYIKGNCKKVY